MTAYHDLDSPQTMREDAAAVVTVPPPAGRTAYADLYAGFPQDQPKAVIEVSEAAQRLANALHLHLD